jgi:hypothetical protein
LYVASYCLRVFKNLVIDALKYKNFAADGYPPCAVNKAIAK